MTAREILFFALGMLAAKLAIWGIERHSERGD